MLTTEKVYSIGEVSKITGLPSSTIRYYDSLDFLPYLQKSRQGIRKFTQKDIDTIRVVECLKQSGLTLKEIQHYTHLVAQGDSSIVDRQQLFHAIRQRLLNKMNDLQKTLKILDYKCMYYDQAAKDGTEKNVLESMSLATVINKLK
ncbi:MerR family transcriptional regulator [Limosilactobacillus sp. STM2_1]|uniref:MerR family transcriptional regulator n=1 Tax=Limosilactobacillus rudii TaxID=2759755 RepID=A0A7W3YNH2_9LACO|nr:MerR family transcriptional regulator [Limosilactobacillus rudii]MBB1079218.1 MerR family transcriptional regulator [Limosilactobacillus rudii]MBB1097307.1 MerR family transcriptional regulator [Limosilactobacillus rudii]MCD7134416.1 MerR family transcriptional regulator [Limosilactobacillus rudii]